MQYYLKKIAISGSISAVFFAAFFYFVYAVEDEKYAPKTSASEKTYTEETVSEVSAIVAQAIEQEVARETKKVARAPVIERITAAPSQIPAPTTPTPTTAFDIPSLPSSLPTSTPIAIPTLPTITIPTAPQPAPTPTPAPRATVTSPPPAPVQPKPAPAPAPRTTVS